MEPAHPLNVFLQLQLASDASAAFHLPFVLETLNSEAFLSSTHLSKWTARITSLLHSKDPGARWAGLCVALETSKHGRDIMMECAQNWIGIALPTLSRIECVPILKASIRLLRYIFTTTIDLPEFQRQLVAPNVPKFSLALLALADKHEEEELKLLCLSTLSCMVPTFPSLHRALHPSLWALSMRLLSGSTVSTSVVRRASHLCSVLHFTGGKVAAAGQWRKAIDETMVFCLDAFAGLRNTFQTEGRSAPLVHSSEDPILTIPFNLERLRCAITLICDLLKTTTTRPVVVPIGALVDLCIALLRCTPNDGARGHVDLSIRTLEVSVIPSIWTLGCTLLSRIASCTRHQLSPHADLLVSIVTHHLEQSLSPVQRLQFIRAVTVLLTHCLSSHSLTTPSRLAKAILPSLFVLLASSSEAKQEHTRTSKKGKKRARGYEGDEVFRVGRTVMCSTTVQGDILLAALDALQLILQIPHLTPSVHSICSRVLLSILLSLPDMEQAAVSADLALHGQLQAAVQRICTMLASGTSSTLSRSLGLVIRTVNSGGSEHFLVSDTDSRRIIDLLLHPRVPPLIRPLPQVETLSLFRAEESQQERDTREVMGLESVDAPIRELEVSARPDANPNKPPQEPIPMDARMGIPTTGQSIIAPPTPTVETYVTPSLPGILAVATTTDPKLHDPVALSSTNTTPHETSLHATPLSSMTGLKASRETALEHQVAGPSSSNTIVPMDEDDDDDNEEMPTINLESDTDSE